MKQKTVAIDEQRRKQIDKRLENLSLEELDALSIVLPTLPGWKEQQAKSRREEQELFGKGRRSWSDEEVDIIFSARLTHEEKMAKLTVLRQAKRKATDKRFH